MNEHDSLADRFEAQRPHLRAVAFRMLGSTSEAEDAVQETWMRLDRTDRADIVNLGGWLRTVVSNVCLDMLRSRRARREELVGEQVPDRSSPVGQETPEREVILVDEVGRALLVVLDALTPAERVAFVLHETFAVPFAEIAPIVGRSPVAAKKLASRARRKVRGTPSVSGAELAEHRQLVEAFLAAARSGDVTGVVAVLAPDVVRVADRAALSAGRATEVSGAQAVAEEIAGFGRNARFAEPALVNGAVGLVVAPHGRLLLALAITVEGTKIARYELIGDPARLRSLELAVLDT
ncbi:RNA polymerase sigma-70 factor, ECF subfamily [Saccharopolyspora antimicrobica]|uniref:RNA polymerase sigma-70 factor (ECF subfamily) n=1 Tax=Saccharopolyspora antimicrobica TaxID=455193 RepID=A0A1I4Z453_9PSEU|nr:sigma-70 family RNA polymerase sigma factor [Saccharopolyspora antimicrobica]RKT82919.1 RNA polymerase sigma-70 factor (ECF subfamily) [Saccharopolyspora antimicrobica]SFN45032.1 RNA polymerase sigma-70 factor, ECF subfamily [Saccharopolyspora antimicrobica]